MARTKITSSKSRPKPGGKPPYPRPQVAMKAPRKDIARDPPIELAFPTPDTLPKTLEELQSHMKKYGLVMIDWLNLGDHYFSVREFRVSTTPTQVFQQFKTFEDIIDTTAVHLVVRTTNANVIHPVENLFRRIPVLKFQQVDSKSVGMKGGEEPRHVLLKMVGSTTASITSGMNMMSSGTTNLRKLART